MLLTHIFAGAQIGPTQAHSEKRSGRRLNNLAMDGFCFEDFGPDDLCDAVCCDVFLILIIGQLPGRVDRSSLSLVVMKEQIILY